VNETPSRSAVWIGRALLVGLGLLLALNLYAGLHNLGQLKRVTLLSGKPAPRFALPLLDGGEFRLEQARGHTVVLDFWATWCGPCKRTLPTVERLFERFGPAGVQFLAVNIEGVEAKELVSAFRGRTGLKLPIGLDDGSVERQYHVESIPHLVVLDGEGTVRGVFNGLHSEAELTRAVEEVGAH
jgi:thiol-disulfide isomerase/thioredoxin